MSGFDQPKEIGHAQDSNIPETAAVKQIAVPLTLANRP